jgi:pyruvate formate lyase activating enzyme
MNIDLKGFTPEFYKKICGDLETVKNTIITTSQVCHIEVTTLVIPGENEGDVPEIAKWLAGIDPNIPYHISRYFPNHEYTASATDVGMIHALAEAAGKRLANVYCGNC